MKRQSRQAPQGLDRVGSFSFLDKIKRGQTIQVTTKDWLTYWRSVEERKGQQIKQLEKQVAHVTAQLRELETAKANLEIDVKQAQGNFDAVRADADGYRDLAVLALIPLAATLGSSSLQTVLLALANAMGRLETGTGGQEPVVVVYFNRIASIVGQISGMLNVARPESYQRVNLLLTHLRKELGDLSEFVVRNP